MQNILKTKYFNLKSLKLDLTNATFSLRIVINKRIKDIFQNHTTFFQLCPIGHKKKNIKRYT